MRNTKKIEKAFQDLNIILISPISEANKVLLAESVTNQFLKVEDTEGNFYLVRFNGKLWLTFTRADEANNLRQLKSHQINSNVIYNDPANGFQICKWIDENAKFSAMSRKNQTLRLIGASIRQYHEIVDFKNKYPVASTIESSFQRIPADNKKKLFDYFHLILRMLMKLSADTNNFVSCHNDLLPSSIYCKSDKSITIVDWEYSGKNHRSYDLALFSIKSALTPDQEENLVTAYDPTDDLSTRSSLILMKPIISLLLLMWGLSSNRQYHDETPLQWGLLRVTTQAALSNKSIRMLIHESWLVSMNRQKDGSGDGCLMKEGNTLRAKL